MATLYDETGAVVTTELFVADASQIGQRRTDVVHDLVLGGLPYVVRKEPSGYGGSLELLCSDVDTAWAVHQAHAAGLVRLDTYTRRNLLTDPRMTAAVWTQQGSTGTFTHATTAGPNGHGYFQYAMDTANTNSPMQVGLAPSGTGGIPVAPGEPIIVSTYWWQSFNQNVQRYDAQWYDAAGTFLSGDLGEDEITPADPPENWYREFQVFTPPALAAFARPIITWSGIYTAPQTLRVADAMVEYGTELRDWFDGSYAPPGYASRWDGLEDASPSSLSSLPAFDMTYTAVNGVDVPHQLEEGVWVVRVPQLQEVAP